MTVQAISGHHRVTANLQKMGYYPTTVEDCKRIGSYFKGYGSTVLDPCAGDGRALKAALSTFEGSAEGLCIEIEEDRAERAKLHFQTYNFDFFSLDIQKESFGLIFLNPPYFHEEKLHQPFIEKSTRLLSPSGWLVLLIPQYEFTGKTAKYLASHYETTQIFRSTDPTFQQLIFIGKKKEVMELTSAEEIEGKAQEANEIEYCESYYRKRVGYTFSLASIRILSRDLDPDWLETVCNEHQDDWKKLMLLLPEAEKVKRPLHPLRNGHRAEILASGLIDGLLIDPDTKAKMLVKGNVERVEEVIEENDYETRTVLKDCVTIQILYEDGNIVEVK